MPISFIMLGLCVIYVSLFHMYKYSNILLIVSLLTVCGAFLTKTLSINNYFGINPLGLIGFVMMFVWLLFTKQVRFYVVVKCMLIAILYVVLFKYNPEYHYLFNYIPLCICTITIAILSRGIIDACVTVFGGMFLVSVTSIFLSRSNLWFAILVDDVIISLTTYCCALILVMWLMLKLIGFVVSRKVFSKRCQ